MLCEIVRGHSRYVIIYFFRSNLLLCLLNMDFLIEFTSFVMNCMEKGVQVDAIYTDFSKAFDKVNHNR
jgi:hypothetical protein